MCPYRSQYATRAIALSAMSFLAVQGFAAKEGDTSGAIVEQTSALGQSLPPAMPAQEQPEVLSRGPVHEAFAEPVALQMQAGVIAPNPPPANIEEVPPAERPQGDQFVWIPGYWAWDADRNGYIWVSACWRMAPPNMSWMPGYWAQVSGGWEWVAGFWTPASAREVEYLPEPPAMADAMEPLVAAPSSDMIWVPPCMYWVRGQYVRRSGYWLPAQQDWVWVPSHYVMTPRGYIFAEGHWDYSLENRGVLFAPIGFPVSVYGRAGFSYSPSVVIDIGLLRASLFAYPRYCHYYFGDYYDDAYLSIGIFPWFDSRRHHSWYDPIYENDRWRHQRSEPRWEEHERDHYNQFRADRNLRPARTFREQESRLAKLPEPQRRALQVAQPLSAAVANRKTPIKFERINAASRQQISKQASDVRTFRDERTRWESTSAKPGTTQLSKEHEPAVKPPAERRETVQPAAKEHRETMTPAERRETIIQPSKEHKAVVAPQPAPERRETVVQPAKEREPAVRQPAERRETVAPTAKERESAVRQPVQRDPAAVQPREANVRQPERVQIPASPITGRSGSPGLSQKGLPARPSDEGNDKDAKDSRGSRSSGR